MTQASVNGAPSGCPLDKDKRNWLVATAVAGGIGAVATAVPFVSTFEPSEKAKAAGAPIDYIALQPTIAYTDGIGVVQRATHPHAAALFFDFMLSDGLLLMKDQQQLTTHKRDKAALDRFKPTIIDPARMRVDYDKWSELYQDMIAGRAPGTPPPPTGAGK